MTSDHDSTSTLKQKNHPRKNRLYSAIFHTLRILLGIIFIYACHDKILHPEAFARTVSNYQILPDATVSFAAVIIPWIELIIGILLITGLWLPGAITVSTGLLFIFSAVLIFNRIRGLDVSCGCFSISAATEPSGWWSVARDIAFFGGSVYLFLFLFFSHGNSSRKP